MRTEKNNVRFYDLTENPKQDNRELVERLDKVIILLQAILMTKGGWA